MSIIRRSEQKTQTLEDFYKEFIPKPEDTFGDVGTPMLEILEFLNLSFKNTIIYGLTSHAQLLLFNSDKSDDYYVSIVGYTYKYDNEFVVEYVIPNDKSPWKGAMVRGVTRQFEDLKKMIIISMTESGGWKDNPELEDRFKNYRS
ncbi:hypothetical protein [Chryseobacterium sp. NKUCC03_KSP]|uniref:hypothetical protein n=1 Tax=Chryseobacterium sp. NKUCC03_KSP TaxID=2842125 RepID=UPI001C5B7092|nr:hypothetical protein [Chryseobacterium sp. NKUCC03_KSP]MBW3521701.1 hypothetical protein [Chryseobacterium sp. NKUCC03_KSP]